MNLLTLTPTGAVPPIDRLLEAADNPYAPPEETTAERVARVKKRGEYSATQTARSILNQRQRRIKDYLSSESGVADWQMLGSRPQPDYTEVVPGLFVNDRVLQKVPASSPVFKMYRRYEEKLDHIQRLSRQSDSAGSVAQRLETKAAKKLVAASAAPKVILPSNIPVNVPIGNTNIHNPWHSKLAGKAVIKYRMVKFAGHPLHTKTLGNFTTRQIAEVTRALHRNKIDWDSGYGFYLYPRNSTTDAQLRGVRWLFTTTGGKFLWLHSSTNKEFHNARGSIKPEDQFLAMSDQAQDDFIQGKI